MGEIYKVYWKNEKKYGKKARKNVNYYAENGTKAEAIKLFNSEIDAGDKITSIIKVKSIN